MDRGSHNTPGDPQPRPQATPGTFEGVDIIDPK